MESQQIQTRIHIIDSNGGDLAYTTDWAILNEFGVKEEKGWNLSVLNIGTVIISPEGGEVKIVDIRTKFYNYLADNKGDYGVNLYGFGERYPFNFEITYIVEKVN